MLAFQFARQVAAAKTPSDFLEAWTAHATKTFDMLTKQASELTTLGRRVANEAAEPVTRAASERE